MRELISFMRQNPHDPILTGVYLANMAVGYYPKKEAAAERWTLIVIGLERDMPPCKICNWRGGYRRGSLCSYVTKRSLRRAEEYV